LISSFRRVLNVVGFLLGNSPASDFRRRGITQKKEYGKKLLNVNLNKKLLRVSSVISYGFSVLEKYVIDAFEKLRKKLCFILCLSFRKEKFGSPWTDFREILVLSILPKSV
jgi:hypothetical protein